MPDDLIHLDLVEIALERTEGTSFERFVHAFYPHLVGTNFVPLGGMHDGGADAYQSFGGIWGDTDPGVFYQASIQADHKSKVKSTVKALKKAGRKPTCLVYITSRRIQKVDSEERQLSSETASTIRIRDRAYIGSHVNDSHETRNSFRHHLGHYLDILKKIGGAQVIGPSMHVRSPAVYVFLRQEVERRSGDEGLTDAVVDSLVLWALEGTDPDQDKFKTRAEIATGIQTAIPFAETLVRGHLNRRLEALSQKGNPSEGKFVTTKKMISSVSPTKHESWSRRTMPKMKHFESEYYLAWKIELLWLTWEQLA